MSPGAGSRITFGTHRALLNPGSVGQPRDGIPTASWLLLDTDEGHAAAAAFDLLAQVAKHKATFFRSGWASYETARPGTLLLMPDATRVKDLRADYRAMAPMMFDQTPPSFDDILAKIAALQETVNS